MRHAIDVGVGFTTGALVQVSLNHCVGVALVGCFVHGVLCLQLESLELWLALEVFLQTRCCLLGQVIRRVEQLTVVLVHQLKGPALVILHLDKVGHALWRAVGRRLCWRQSLLATCAAGRPLLHLNEALWVDASDSFRGLSAG